jgi:uncharacterized membrane protein
VATLTAWMFPTPTGADEALTPLDALRHDGLVTVHDAATVSWPVDRKGPRTTTEPGFAGTAALGGAFWGLLFGLVFFVPLLGIAAGAFIGSRAFPGIDPHFIDTVRANVRPGTSALFVLSSDAVLDRVHETFPGQPAELVTTHLSPEDDARLRDAFAD